MLGMNHDVRTLGVRVYAVTAEIGAVVSQLVLASEALGDGWSWLEETAEGQAFRWTHGDAALPDALLCGGRDDVVLTVGWDGLGRYFVAPAAAPACDPGAALLRAA
jgi:hypothetical protein